MLKSSFIELLKKRTSDFTVQKKKRNGQGIIFLGQQNEVSFL